MQFYTHILQSFLYLTLSYFKLTIFGCFKYLGWIKGLYNSTGYTKLNKFAATILTSCSLQIIYTSILILLYVCCIKPKLFCSNLYPWILNWSTRFNFVHWIWWTTFCLRRIIILSSISGLNAVILVIICSQLNYSPTCRVFFFILLFFTSHL